MWIADDLVSQVTREEYLDLAGYPQLLRRNYRQLCPFPTQLSCSPVIESVHSRAFGLRISRHIRELVSSLCCTLGDIIITAAGEYLTPKSDLLRVLLDSKFLN